MKEKITLLQKEIEEKIKEVKNLDTLNELKVKYLSKKGPVSELTNSLRDLSIEEKKEFGKLITDFRNDVMSKVDALKQKYELEELNRKLESEKIDISMPGMEIKNGSPSIVEDIIDTASDFFISLGYDVVEGPEIELDKYNFEMLNLPKEHPARDAQDTYYLKDEDILLRSQTSPVQVRTILEGKGEKPIRIICPVKYIEEKI